ncbi:MAG TPA: amidohydrolase family protein [Bryobacteraceae bacterium]|nr:amidohydrolase family protein [Bryobacteraceae bacterium]HPU72813.1 amidohydrolase family protein [Bryobacteraceae bacterium]
MAVKKSMPGCAGYSRATRAAVLATLALAAGAAAQKSPETLLLKDYRPVPIHKIPVTEVPKAKYPAVDMHTHVYAKTPEEVAEWVKTMDAAGTEKTIVLTGATGERFDALQRIYAKFPDRFDLWCGIDRSRAGQPDFAETAVRELERCFRAGARGVGEISDKGSGIFRGADGARIHPDDPRLDPIWRKCGELNLPVNIHVADPIWAYGPMDETNDGLMNAFKWRLDDKPDIVKFEGMMEILERTVKRHPGTIFIACHLANLDFDLTRLGRLLDTYPNLYVDVSARFGELASTPRASAKFLIQYAGRVMYGTDQGRMERVYRRSFRILETLDEHFYYIDGFNYHWNLSGLGLPDPVLKQIYRDTALRLIARTPRP